MAIQSVNASLRGPRASVVKYDIVAAINGAGLAKASLSKDLAQRLTLLIVSRYNWLTNEVSAGHMQLSALWSVDLRRVKRILAELRTLGVLAVKRAGRKGLVTVYCLDLAKIAEITRPFWHVLGADIAARLDTAFPDENAAPKADGEDASRVEHPENADASPTNIVKIDEARRQRADPVRQAIARELAPPAFDRWIRPLVHERRQDCFVFVADSQQFCRELRRTTVRPQDRTRGPATLPGYPEGDVHSRAELMSSLNRCAAGAAEPIPTSQPSSWLRSMEAYVMPHQAHLRV